jgi:cytochrome c oxidase assembly protein subunit 15
MIRKTLQLSRNGFYNKQFIKFNYAQEYVKPGKEKVVGAWLFATAAGILGMIVLGGYTRLTHSGLSMADWSPYTKKYPQNEK